NFTLSSEYDDIAYPSVGFRAPVSPITARTCGQQQWYGCYTGEGRDNATFSAFHDVHSFLFLVCCETVCFCDPGVVDSLWTMVRSSTVRGLTGAPFSCAQSASTATFAASAAEPSTDDRVGVTYSRKSVFPNPITA